MPIPANKIEGVQPMTTTNQHQASAQPQPAGKQAQEAKANSRQKVEGFTGSSESRATWKTRIVKALDLPKAKHPLEFYDISEAQKSIKKTINEKFDVPAFEDLEIGWRWEQMCRDVVHNLKRTGHIKFPMGRELWLQEARAAKLAAEQGADENGSQEAADTGAERQKAAWDEGYERGHSEGYKKGRDEALAEVIDMTQRLAQKPHGHDKSLAASSSTQLEATLDKLEFFDDSPPDFEDRTLFCAFGGRPGTLSGNNREREGSVSSSDSHTQFPNRLAGHIFRPLQSPSGPHMSPFAKLSSSPSWMEAKAAAKAPTPQKRRLSESSVEDGEVVECKSKKVRG